MAPVTRTRSRLPLAFAASRSATASEEPEANNSIKMEVGIEDCLHIEFEYNHSKYHLKDVVLGKIFFLLVRSHPSPPAPPA